LEIRYAAVSLVAPRRRHGPALAVWAVLAQEYDAPAGVKPLEWMLLTTVEVQQCRAGLREADVVLAPLGHRSPAPYPEEWLPHRAAPLGQADRLGACLAIDLVVAWRIYHLSKLGREDPQAPCTVYFKDAEWKALTAFTTKNSAASNQAPPCAT
jgi:hypothetical protein